jgi:hypothetical protein
MTNVQANILIFLLAVVAGALIVGLGMRRR